MPLYRSPDILSGSDDEVADIDGIVWTIPDGIQSADNAAKTFTVTANFKRNGADVAIKLAANAFGIHGISSATATHAALTTAATSVVITVSIPANRHGSVYLQLNNGASSDPDDYPLGTQFSPTIAVDTRAVPEDADIDGILWQIPDGTQIADGAIKTFDVTANFKRNGADQAIKLAADAFSVHGISSATATSPALTTAATSVVITVSIPADRHGSVYLQLVSGSASEPDDFPLETQFSPTVIVDTRAEPTLIPKVSPDVIIGDIYAGSKSPSIVVTFTWTQDVAGFTVDDLSVDVGTLSQFSGEGNVYSVLLTFPVNASGVVTLTVSEKSATNEIDAAGPIGNRTYSIGYDTVPGVFPNPTNSCVKTYAFNDATNPFIDGAGVIQPPLEMIGFRRGNIDYILAVIQVSPYTPLFEPQPGSPTLIANGINTQVQASAALVEINLSTCTWRVLEKYPFVSTAPRSLLHINGNSYFFRGSHYAYYNEGVFKVIQSPDGEFYQSLGELERKVSATEAGEYQVLTSPNRLRILLDRNAADYANQKEALKTKDRLVLGEGLIVHISNYAVQEAGDIGTVTVNYTIDGTLPAIDAETAFRVNIGEYTEAFSNYRLRDLYNQAEFYATDWKSQIGRLYGIDNTGIAITDLGLNWVSSNLSEMESGEHPYWERNPKPDKFYAVHGGTASPLVNADGELRMITGYGDLDKVADNASEAARLANWQQIAYDTKLSRNFPVLTTNARTGWDIVKDAALITNSYVAFDAGELIFKPRTPVKAKLSQSIPAQNYPSSSIFLKEPSRSTLPSSGDILIGSEIFSYTGVSGGNLTPFSRAQEATIAELHEVDADVFWIDHILYWDKYAIDPVDAIHIENDTTRIFNVVQVGYGDKVYEVRDASSISDYGLRELSLDLPLDATQLNVAKYLAQTYLSELKKPRQLIRLRLKLSLYLNIMDTLIVRESDRSHLSEAHLMQVIDLDNRVFENETSVTGVLLKSID